MGQAEIKMREEAALGAKIRMIAGKDRQIASRDAQRVSKDQQCLTPGIGVWRPT